MILHAVMEPFARSVNIAENDYILRHFSGVNALTMILHAVMEPFARSVDISHIELNGIFT
jgi:hypothetical protein